MSEPAFDRLLAELADNEIDFILVGGLALNAWGVIRGTKDVDVVIDRSAENLSALAELVSRLGGKVQLAESFLSSPPAIRAALESGERTLIDTDLGPLDVVQGLSGVPTFEKLRAGAQSADVLGSTVLVCSREDLREMKIAAGRHRDLADLEDLDAVDGP